MIDKLKAPDPDIPHMSYGTHWVLRIVALIVIGLLIYSNHH